MDKGFRQQGSEVQESGHSLDMQFFDRSLKWLITLFLLTEEEQKNAGIYLGDPYSQIKEKQNDQSKPGTAILQ
jgi:hypothetical protein